MFIVLQQQDANMYYGIKSNITTEVYVQDSTRKFDTSRF
jgi:hypothetical protein